MLFSTYEWWNYEQYVFLPTIRVSKLEILKLFNSNFLLFNKSRPHSIESIINKLCTQIMRILSHPINIAEACKLSIQ